jgi:hypothetical protein
MDMLYDERSSYLASRIGLGHRQSAELILAGFAEKKVPFLEKEGNKNDQEIRLFTIHHRSARCSRERSGGRVQADSGRRRDRLQ